MRTYKRRNLTSSQWAAIAVEADEIIKAISIQVEKERRAKQSGTQSGTKKQVFETKSNEDFENEKEVTMVQLIVPQERVKKDTSKLCPIRIL